MAPRSLHPALLAMLAVLVAAVPAAGAGEAQRKAEARDWYQRGLRHYELGELDVAARELKRAYELNPAPGLLFNLGQVYRLKKDDEQALHFYRTYLRLQPDAHNRAMVESLMAELRARMEDKARAPRPAPATPEPGPTVTTPPAATPRVVEPVAPSPTVAPAVTAVVPAPPPPPPRGRWRTKVWIGGGAAALGLGALGAALGLALHANDSADGLG